MYPGYGTGWVGPGGYTGYYPAPSQDPNIRLILEIRPYLRPNEGKSEVLHEVSQIWPQKGSQNASE